MTNALDIVVNNAMDHAPDSNGGSVFIDIAHLQEMTWSELLAAEHNAGQFITDHPEFEFVISQALHGYVVRWRRRKWE